MKRTIIRNRHSLFCAALMLMATTGEVQAAFRYNFQFTTSPSFSSTGIDGEVKGYFTLPDATNGIISSVSDALLIDSVVVTSDTTGTGFEPIGINLLSYSDLSIGLASWQLGGYNGLVTDGVSGTGQVRFSSCDTASCGGYRPGLTIGLSPTDSQQRTGSISWNPDMGVDLGNWSYAAGGLLLGDTVSITAIPEPSSLLLVVLTTSLFCLGRREKP